MRISDWSSDVCSSDLCNIVVAMVTNKVWNREVPTTTCVAMPRRYSMAGTMMKPPPTPKSMVNMPDNTPRRNGASGDRSEEHTSELQSLMRISYAVFCLKKKKKHKIQ